MMSRPWLGTLILPVVLILTPGAHSAEQHDLKVRLAVAPSQAACVEFAKRFQEFGEVRSRTFESTDVPLFVTWIEPYPDKKPVSFVFGYFYRDNGWHLFLDEFVEARQLSVRVSEAKNRLIVTSGDSGELFSRSVQNPTPLSEQSSR